MLALLLTIAMNCGDLCTPAAAHWYDDLLAESGYGRLPVERAAFLIRERNGSLTIAPWSTEGFRHASYRGAIPAGTIAILHTHPKGEPQPSARDQKEARRLQLPVVVITPASVIAAQPDGAIVTLR